MRADQHRRLTGALPLERQAVAELERALDALGAEPARGPAADKGEKKLSGLRQAPAWMTHMGCLIGCEEFLKAGGVGVP